MPTFEYTALDTAGARVRGALGGASESAVLAELESRKLTPVRVREKPERRSVRRGVPARSLAASYVQLGDLLGAGVPVMRSLSLLSRQKSSPRLSGVYRSVAEAVSDGGDLGEAMARHADIFPRTHVAMVSAGEKGGFLEQVFQRLGAFVQGQAELRSKLMGGLIYPAVLIIFGVAILAVIFGIFIPKFEPLFARLDELPMITTLVLGASKLISGYAWLVGILLVLLVVGLAMLRRNPAGARQIAVIVNRLPLVGPLSRDIAAARFCRMLGTMESNGVPLIQAMTIARDAAGHLLLEEAIKKAIESVRSGESLAAPLGASGMFSDDTVEMISVGEAAGNVDQVLLNIAGAIERRVDHTFTVGVRLVEPLLLAVIAVVIATVAVSLILPMMQLSGSA